MDGHLRRHSEIGAHAGGCAATALHSSLKHSWPTADHLVSTVYPDAAGLSSTSALQSEFSSAGWGHCVQYSAGSSFQAARGPLSATAAAPEPAHAGLTLPHISPDDIMQLAEYFGEDDLDGSHQQIPSGSNSAACTAALSHHSGRELQCADTQDLGCSNSSVPSMPSAADAAVCLKCADPSNLPVLGQMPVYPLHQRHSLDHTFSINSWQTVSAPQTPASCNLPGEYPCIPSRGQGNSSPRSSTITGDNEYMGSKHLTSVAAHLPPTATNWYAAAAAAVSVGSPGASGTQGLPASPASPPAAAAAAAKKGRGAATGGATASNRRERSAAPAVNHAVDQRREVNRLTQQRLRRERQAEHLKLRDQLAIMTDQVSRLQASFRSQQASNSELLSRLADITSKWRDSVAENARLSTENVAVRAQVADLQMQLMMYQPQQHQRQQWAGI